jgi:hypothetical protein
MSSDSSLRELRNRLGEVSAFESRLLIVEEYLLDRVHRASPRSEITASANFIFRGRGAVGIAALASAHALGLRNSKEDSNAKWASHRIPLCATAMQGVSANFWGVIRNCGRGSTAYCAAAASPNMRCFTAVQRGDRRQSMCCWAQAPISASALSYLS